MNPMSNRDWFGTRIAKVFPEVDKIPGVQLNAYGVPASDFVTLDSLNTFLRVKGITTRLTDKGWGFTYHGVKYDLGELNELEAMAAAYETLMGIT